MRDETFFQALKRCAALPIPSVPENADGRPCYFVVQVRTHYPALLPIIGSCPVGPEPSPPAGIIAQLSEPPEWYPASFGWLSASEREALRDYTEEEYGRVLVRYRDNKDFCESLPGPRPTPAPDPKPEPPPHPGPALPDPAPIFFGLLLAGGLFLWSRKR